MSREELFAGWRLFFERLAAVQPVVLGSSFPADALIAVSGRDEPSVRAGLDELLRREVLSVSADPLSPERGSYQFAQELLRQVAYDTLSRRDRKTRHLAVAAHLRAVFAGDGEEMADVIARHYLDALHDAGKLWEHAAQAAIVTSDYAAAIQYADHARQPVLDRADATEGTWPQVRA